MFMKNIAIMTELIMMLAIILGVMVFSIAMPVFATVLFVYVGLYCSSVRTKEEMDDCNPCPMDMLP